MWSEARAASGSPGSQSSVIASCVCCSVSSAVLCWCRDVPVDRARIAAMVGNSARSGSGPLGGVYVDMVGGAAVSLAAPVTVP